MRIITRNEQRQRQAKQDKRPVWPAQIVDDRFFDGTATPRTISPRRWLAEGAVHQERILSDSIDSTRYLMGPQISILRDDNRRVTWAVTCETSERGSDHRRLLLHRLPGAWPTAKVPPSPEHRYLTEGDLWRYHLALDKFTGEVITTWITGTGQSAQLWVNGVAIDTKATLPDFPFFELSQPPIGHVPAEASPFAILGYKCRKSGAIFVRRVVNGTIEAETRLEVGTTVGGISFAISKDTVLARVDLLEGGELVPALIRSNDAGRTFEKPSRIDLSRYEKGFKVIPGFTRPVVDVGGHLHVPIHVGNGNESVALNYVVREDALVEAIRVRGSDAVAQPPFLHGGVPKVSQEVFPATLGNPNPYGNGITDGHGLIMVLNTDGRLYSSNSSAGGMFYPPSAHLNYEMPLISVFATTECYTSGLKPNYVSMDYLYLETDTGGFPISPRLHFETWDMPLPVPTISAIRKGSEVLVTVQADTDLEPGHVTFSFDDPSIQITDVEVTGLRTATVKTNTAELAGKTIQVDVDALFHRHYGEAVIS
jgi:hypothetical protein